MKLANCPQCGAQVKFHAAASVLAVCEYCTATLMRHGEALEHIGKMAELQDDPTLIQIGSEGVYKGVHFGVIGRIQMQYEAGLWNEWHIMFDDMKTGWLGEAAGEFYVTFEKTLPLSPPPFNGINAEDKIDIGGRFFTVTNLESATCIAGQGELPFSVGPGFSAPVIDLQLDREFATIDYSDDPPRVFTGERVTVRDLKLANLRDARAAPDVLAPKHKADAFNCPSCAAPFNLSSGKIQTYGCASCGSILDTTNKKVQLVTKAQEAMSYPLRIPLGARGRFAIAAQSAGSDNTSGKSGGKTGAKPAAKTTAPHAVSGAANVEWEAIGHMRRASDAGFSWSEYLLFNPEAGYAWLSESDGHWSLSRNVEQIPKVLGLSTYYKGESLEHFQQYTAEVVHVLGEFYWKVKVGDSVLVDDYIAPPRMLSREKTTGEVSWSQGTYLTQDEVVQAFKVKTRMPEPKGIAPNQPSPFAQTNPHLWKRFALFALIGLVAQMWFAFTTTAVLKDSFTVTPQMESSKTTEPFTIKGNGPLLLDHSAGITNGWAGFGFTLVEPGSGKVWRAEQQLEYYEGYDDGHWSEGSRSGQVVFAAVPPGTYQLEIEGEMAKDARQPVNTSLRLERGHASWLNWLLLQGLLLMLPLWGLWRVKAFETKRWADSDHPRGGSDDDDD